MGIPQGHVVALHGWGDNARNFGELIPYLQLEGWECTCLEAPFPHPGGIDGRAWYNLSQPSPAAIDHSKAFIRAHLQTLPADRTVLLGFSQGAAMTLEVGLDIPLAALIVLSGYLHPLPQKPQAAPPVLMVHGTEDGVVPVAAAHQARSVLEGYAIPVQYHEFPIGHTISVEVIAVIRSFMGQLL